MEKSDLGSRMVKGDPGSGIKYPGSATLCKSTDNQTLHVFNLCSCLRIFCNIIFLNLHFCRSWCKDPVQFLLVELKTVDRQLQDLMQPVDRQLLEQRQPIDLRLLELGQPVDRQLLELRQPVNLQLLELRQTVDLQLLELMQPVDPSAAGTDAAGPAGDNAENDENLKRESS
jgi:hypothetical protein